MMKRMHWLIIAIMALILSISSGASAWVDTQKDGVAVTEGTELEKAVKASGGRCADVVNAFRTENAKCQSSLGTCETQKADLQKATDKCQVDLNECREKKDCTPKPKKVYIPVNVCVAPAVKVGNRCSCEAEPKLKEKNAVPVSTDGKWQWVRYWTCAYPSDAVYSAVDELNSALSTVCTGLSEIPSVDEGQRESAQQLKSLLERCTKATDTLTKATTWAVALQVEANDVPPFDRAAWESIYKDLAILCRKTDEESLTIACAREKQWRDGVEDTLKKHGAILANHEGRIQKLEHRATVDVTAWRIGAELSYAYRMGQVPASTRAGGTFSIYHQFSESVALSGGVLGGYADNKWSKRYLAGLTGKAHFIMSETTAIVAGVRLDFEVVPDSVDAGNGYGTIAVDYKPPRSCLFIQPGIGLGSSLVRKYVDGQRTHNVQGLSLLPFVEIGYDTSCNNDVVSAPPPSANASSNTSSTSVSGEASASTE